MTESTLTSKGQTTIPQEVRKQLNLEPGQRLAFTVLSDSEILIRVKNRSIEELAGCLAREGEEPLPISELSR